jgi:hypothetical protein
MKLKTTLSVLLSMGATAAIAQPTLTASTSTPVAGLTEVYNQNTTYLPGSEGANQNWDFSTQSFPTVSNLTFEACNGSNNCAAFPGSTVVGHQGSNYIYYGGSSTALTLNGVAANGINIPYNDPQDFFRFPMAYGNAYTDTWGATLTNGGVTFYRSGIDSVSADAWGTLKTPAGTFTNTLRVKRISTYKDSANVGGMPIIINYKMTLYSWNDLNHKDVLYSTSSLVANNQGNENTTNTSTYVTSQETGISDASATKLNLKISPNPANDYVQISMTLTEKSNVDINIVDITGRSVYNKSYNTLRAGNNQLEISTSELLSGVYIVKIRTGNNFVSRKLLIESFN